MEMDPPRSLVGIAAGFGPVPQILSQPEGPDFTYPRSSDTADAVIEHEKCKDEHRGPL